MNGVFAYTVVDTQSKYDYILSTPEVPGCDVTNCTVLISQGCPLAMSTQVPSSLTVWTEKGVLCIGLRVNLARNIWMFFVFNYMKELPVPIEHIAQLENGDAKRFFLFGKEMHYIARFYTVKKREFDGDYQKWNILVYWLFTKMTSHQLTSMDTNTPWFVVRYLKQFFCQDDADVIEGLYAQIHQNGTFHDTLDRIGAWQEDYWQASVVSGRELTASIAVSDSDQPMRGSEPFVKSFLERVCNQGMVIGVHRPHSHESLDGYITTCMADDTMIARGNRSQLTKKLYFLTSWCCGPNIALSTVLRVALPQALRFSDFYFFTNIAAYRDEHYETLEAFAKMGAKVMQIDRRYMPYDGICNASVSDKIRYYKVLFCADRNEGYMNGELAECLLI